LFSADAVELYLSSLVGVNRGSQGFSVCQCSDGRFYVTESHVVERCVSGKEEEEDEEVDELAALADCE
jgi:hypothetical protein